jgi:hypothetical protein
LLLTVVATAQVANAATFTVLNANDSGFGSLRQVIGMVNGNFGGDTITFDPSLSGKTITLLSPLPGLTETRTHIDGDLNDDAKPDITLDGAAAGVSADGLYVSATATFTVIEGLAITGFDGVGVYVDRATDVTIESCHLGVNRVGTKNVPNNGFQVELKVAYRAHVGQPGKPNVISAGQFPGDDIAVYVEDTRYAVIGPNYIGVNRAGTAALGNGVNGVYLATVSLDCRQNTVRDSVMAGLNVGVWLENTDANRVYGCTFGLAADGHTPIEAVGSIGLLIRSGSSGNVIGSDQTARRNVFVGASGSGVYVVGLGAEKNLIEGNYFGTDASGTQQLALGAGVWVTLDAGPQTIGGATAALGNYFATPSGDGIDLNTGGMNSTIRHNRFGVLPAGGDVPGTGKGIFLESMAARILDNTFARLNWGIYASGAAAAPEIYGNTFRRCTTGVYITGNARPQLGNLANASTADDGLNHFRNSTANHIENETPNKIKAEGNDFGTTVKAAIEAKIWDKLDNGSLGRVDFIPLKGNVIPSGAGGGVAALAVTGAAAVPTATGAEITFTLSAPAQVTVEILNLAGRPVALPARARASNAGLQRLAWNGRSLTGAAAPAGTYLARITARDAAGAQATAVMPVPLNR